MVPTLNLTGKSGSSLNLEFSAAVGPGLQWTTLDFVVLSQGSQLYFDVSAPLPPQRFYRVSQTMPAGITPALSCRFVPALTLSGNIGDSVRVDYINAKGPTDAWWTLDTITLTNTSQLYFDTSSIGQPRRLYRLVTVP